jgi:hypothetical protein
MAKQPKVNANDVVRSFTKIAGQTLISAEIATARPTPAPASQLEVLGVRTPKPAEERVNFGVQQAERKGPAP